MDTPLFTAVFRGYKDTPNIGALVCTLDFVFWTARDGGLPASHASNFISVVLAPPKSTRQDPQHGRRQPVQCSASADAPCDDGIRGVGMGTDEWSQRKRQSRGIPERNSINREWGR